MTLEEKAAQLEISGCIWFSKIPFDPNTATDGDRALAAKLRARLLSSVYGSPGAIQGREIQRIAVEESRLGIPVIFADEVNHGYRTTIYPISLGEAASFEPELARRTARAAAEEASSRGVHWTFAPVADLARDQRWGRVVEGAGEDPFLASSFLAARVRGFQGDDATASDSLVATIKHFAAYGSVAAGLEYNYVDLSAETLRDVVLPPYKAAVDAGALAVMTSFNDINGVPSTANRWLLTELLRGEWGFQGVVISNAESAKELVVINN